MIADGLLTRMLAASRPDPGMYQLIRDLRGKGVRDPRTGATGDHLYTVRVMVPRTQTPAGMDAATLLDSLYETDVRADLPKGL